MSLSRLQSITSGEWRVAPQLRFAIRRNALNVLGFRTVRDFLEDYRHKTVSVTLYGGSGTRWISSVQRAQVLGQSLDIDVNKAKALASIPDVFKPGNNIPIGAYNLRAVRGLSDSPIVIYRGEKIDFQNMAKAALLDNAQFIEQRIPAGFNQPLGHGDVMHQIFPGLDEKVEFIIANFGCDSDPRDVIVTALLVLAAMQKTSEELRPWGILPTTFLQSPAYPIAIDENGMPISIGHPKLMGTQQLGPAQSNAGPKLYCRRQIRDALDFFFGTFDPKYGYRIPGNKSNEFSLDNIDAFLIERARLRLLHVAFPDEVGEVKKMEDIERFLEVQRKIEERRELSYEP